MRFLSQRAAVWQGTEYSFPAVYRFPFKQVETSIRILRSIGIVFRAVPGKHIANFSNLRNRRCKDIDFAYLARRRQRRRRND